MNKKLPHCSCHRRITASSLIAFYRSGARGGATRGALADRFVFQRGMGATRPAWGVCRPVGKVSRSSWSVVFPSSVSRLNRCGQSSRSLDVVVVVSCCG